MKKNLTISTLAGTLALATALVSCNPSNSLSTNVVGSQKISVVDSEGTFEYVSLQGFMPTIKNIGELSELERGLFESVNAERSKGGQCVEPDGTVHNNPPTNPLKLEARIYKAASNYAAEMVAGNFEGHIHPSNAALKTPARRMVKQGYTPKAPIQGSSSSLFFEENLAYGYYEYSEVIAAWKRESFNHCMTIYEPLSYGAVAVKDGILEGSKKTKYERYWVLNVSGKRQN